MAAWAFRRHFSGTDIREVAAFWPSITRLSGQSALAECTVEGLDSFHTQYGETPGQ